ncbi:MAG: hypothetical protein LBK60_01390 [Verrucomicrobiales bacterium]|jgi:hypothetical protein|nr:hypothetical protein [Verrucomicrobiales bacterium]
MAKKLWYMEFEVSAWLKDPALTRCSASTRGVWMDLLCAMHELDQCGVISGSRYELARLGRCTVAELGAALQDLQRTGAGDVSVSRSNGSDQNAEKTQGDEIITVVSRRMRRKFNERKSHRERQKRWRDKAGDGEVTPRSQPPNPHPHPSGGEIENGKLTIENFSYGDAGRLRGLARKLGAAVQSEPLPEWAVFEAEARRVCPNVQSHRVKDWWGAMGRTRPRLWRRWLNECAVRELRNSGH